MPDGRRTSRYCFTPLQEGLLDAKVVRGRLDATPLREKDIVKLYAVWALVLQLAESGDSRV